MQLSNGLPFPARRRLPLQVFLVFGKSGWIGECGGAPLAARWQGESSSSSLPLLVLPVLLSKVWQLC